MARFLIMSADMKWLCCLASALALPGAMCAAAMAGDKPVESKHMEDVARGYVDAFLQGNSQVLLDHAAPELRALMKDAASVNALREFCRRSARFGRGADFH